MYIKTDEINNGCDYLTAGKVYEAVNVNDPSIVDNDVLFFTDDEGDDIAILELNFTSHTNSHWYECDEHGNKLPSIDHYQSDTEQVTITLSKADKDALERVLEALKGS
jgi:hypothetical protein